MKNKPPYLTINSLMKYLRDKHNITIGGSRDKQILQTVGYYHGYKGYRFFNNKANRINYKSLNELMSVYHFDTKLKTIFYPQVMFLETAFKNLVLEITLENAKSNKFNDIYNIVLDNYKCKSKGKDNAICERLRLRDMIHDELTRAYTSKSKAVIRHFYDRDDNIPIWAIFEIIDFGKFGHYVECMNDNCREQISKRLDINIAFNTGYDLPYRIIYALKDLRNAVAHNDPIFDTRFKKREIDSSLKGCIEKDTDINNVSFKYPIDYLIFTIYLLKRFFYSKRDMLRIVNEFQTACEILRSSVDISVYSSILPSDTRNKIYKLSDYIISK